MGFLDKPVRPLPLKTETSECYCEQCKTMELHIFEFQNWYCGICGTILKENRLYECQFCRNAIIDEKLFKEFLKPEPINKPEKCDYCHKKPKYLDYLDYIPDIGKFICSDCFEKRTTLLPPKKYENFITDILVDVSIYCKIKKRLFHKIEEVCNRFKMI